MMPEWKDGDCKFCYDLELMKHLARKARRGAQGFYNTYTAALVQATYKRGSGKRASITLKARPLNFCPECGRPLKRKKESSPGGT